MLLRLVVLLGLGLGSGATDLPDPATVLHAWDRAREAAWVGQDPAALRGLYDAPAAARADVTLLRTYGSRGWRVTSLRPQVFALQPVEVSAERLRLVVDERILTSVSGPGSCEVLPASAPRRREVTLRREAGEWRVVRVTQRGPQRSPQ